MTLDVDPESEGTVETSLEELLKRHTRIRSTFLEKRKKVEDTSAVLSVAEKSPFEGEPENFAPATKSASGNVLDSFSARFRAARFSSLKKPDEDHNYSMSQIDDVNPKTDAASKRHNIPMSGDSQELQSPKSILKLRSSNLGTLTQNSPKTVNFKESPSIAKSSSLHLDSRSLNLSSDGARIEELPSKDEFKPISGPATSGVVAPTITPDREDSNVASSQGFALSYSRSVSTAPASAELAFRSESRDNDSIRNAVADCMEEYLLSLKQDLQNMHLDLLKQFHQHKREYQDLFENHIPVETTRLRQENEVLRREIRTLKMKYGEL